MKNMAYYVKGYFLVKAFFIYMRAFIGTEKSTSIHEIIK